MNPRFYLLPLFFVLLSWIILRYAPAAPSSDEVEEPFTDYLLDEHFMNKPPKLDNFQLVHVWIPTFCKHSIHHCKGGLPQDFTLHGLWPAKSDGQTIKGDHHDDISAQINELRKDLEEAWPNVRSDQTDDSLWTREWNKHGCMSQMITLDYLKTSIAQSRRMKPVPHEKNNLLVFLERAHIVPSDTQKYSWDEIEQAILKGIGQGKGRIYLYCEQVNKEYLLYEIKICLHKTTMNYIPCHARTIVSCGQKKKDKNIKITLA